MTFAEFVKGFLLAYELNEEPMDDYWRPQSDNCNICLMNYTFVGKVATFRDDIRNITQLL